MILLDTNYLIRLLVPSTDEATRLTQWIDQEEILATAAVSWYEFCCGPVNDAERDLVLSLLAGRILPLTETAARYAARLFNATGRLRTLRVDSMIAGTALEFGATVASSNSRDFGKFAPFGVRSI